jgi:hypothetical protein
MPAYGRKKLAIMPAYSRLYFKLQGCRARLPGKAAGQGCRARLPGKAAGQGCRARLPGKAACMHAMQWCNMLKAW